MLFLDVVMVLEYLEESKITLRSQMSKVAACYRVIDCRPTVVMELPGQQKTEISNVTK